MQTDVQSLAARHDPAAVDQLRRQVRELWAAGNLSAAYAVAWDAFAQHGDDRKIKWVLTELLRWAPAGLEAERRAAYLKLLIDPEVEPDMINSAGWRLALEGQSETVADAALPAFAAHCESDELALELLRQAPVGLAAAERLLTHVRRWLLLSGRWQEFPALVLALKTQAGLNGGAWTFSEEERAQFADPENAGMAAAYLPPRPEPDAAPIPGADPVTRAVTAQYEGYPYPVWTRFTRREPQRLTDMVHKMDPVLAARLPVAANILVAGCGTGRQAAAVAAAFPDAIVTAIDVSQASLNYAKRACARLGIGGIRFERLDLHDVAALGQRFDCIYCSGVLHHLPDPERGWKHLVDVLAPDGVMSIMVYNLIARLRVRGGRGVIADLMGKPIDDDLLRRVRARILERTDHPLAQHTARSRDFPTLAGAYDLLLHRHEDPFDLPRIARALDALGLRLLHFELLTPAAEARYAAAVPDDPERRDIKKWMRYEREHPGLDLGNYVFWCGRTADEVVAKGPACTRTQ